VLQIMRNPQQTGLGFSGLAHPQASLTNLFGCTVHPMRVLALLCCRLCAARRPTPWSTSPLSGYSRSPSGLWSASRWAGSRARAHVWVGVHGCAQPWRVDPCVCFYLHVPLCVPCAPS